MQLISSLFAGLIFGLGLVVSGMSNPAKVIGFLDLAGHWDPSLAFVMGGAVAVGVLAFRVAGRRARSLLGMAMNLPTGRRIDRRLVLGSITFGIGWGLGGYCPGPALTAVLVGGIKPVLFVASMLAGMGLYELFERHARVQRLQAESGAIR